MRTVQKIYYTFDELSDDAKASAIDSARLFNVEDEFWYEFTIDDAKRCASLLGIDIDNIYFSGFANQGDGACFTGRYQYRKGWRKALRSEIGGDDLTTLERIGEDLQELQRRAFYQITATATHSGRYYHAGCMDVSVEATTPAGDDICHEFLIIEDGITEFLRSFAHWIYRSLEKEFDYQTSDDAIAESLEANGMEFDEDGHLI